MDAEAEFNRVRHLEYLTEEKHTIEESYTRCKLISFVEGR